MNPLVSILIPAYNAEKWLAETLESALAQTWSNKEIIVVDDGSTDNTLAIAKSFESNGVKLKILHQKNKGQCAAFNLAFQNSQGDFIEYLDADDVLTPEKIEKQIQLLGYRDSEFVVSGEWARFHKTIEEAKFIPEPVWKDFSPIDWLICSWEGGGMMHGAAWLIPRKLADQAGPWNESLSLINDFDFFTRVLLVSKGVKFCWGSKTYYRSGLTNSLSGTKSYNARKSEFASLEFGTNLLLSYENSPRTRHACATVFQRFVYSVYPNYPEFYKKAEQKVGDFGGASLRPEGGSIFLFLSNFLGWKISKRIQGLRNIIK